MHAVEYVVDLPLQHHPHRPDAAALGLRTALFADRVRHAMQIERAELRGRDHFTYGDVLGCASQRITAARPAGTVYQAGATQSEQDLLDVVGRQSLAGGDLPAGDRALARPPCEMKGTDQPVLGPRRDAHSIK